MEKQESSEESTKATVSSQRRCIKHFGDVFGYIPGSTLQYDTDRSQVLKLKLPALNVGVFGRIAAGKSCFINTAESVLSGEYSDRAGENRLAKEGDKCILEATTAERIKVRVGQKMCLIDNRGFPKKCDESIAEEVVKQCGKPRVKCILFVYLNSRVFESISTRNLQSQRPIFTQISTDRKFSENIKSFQLQPHFFRRKI